MPKKSKKVGVPCPAKFAETYHELMRSIRREVRNNMKMSDLSKPIAMRLGEKYELMATVEANIANRIAAMWRKEHGPKKRLGKDELLPCPFCGGEARHFGGAGLHCIRCTKCGVTNEMLHIPKKKAPTADSCYYVAHDSYEKARLAWNRRA